MGFVGGEPKQTTLSSHPDGGDAEAGDHGAARVSTRLQRHRSAGFEPPFSSCLEVRLRALFYESQLKKCWLLGIMRKKWQIWRCWYRFVNVEPFLMVGGGSRLLSEKETT